MKTTNDNAMSSPSTSAADDIDNEHQWDRQRQRDD